MQPSEESELDDGHVGVSTTCVPAYIIFNVNRSPLPETVGALNIHQLASIKETLEVKVTELSFEVERQQKLICSLEAEIIRAQGGMCYRNQLIDDFQDVRSYKSDSPMTLSELSVGESKNRSPLNGSESDADEYADMPPLIYDY
jgi:hypothetical protein